MPKAIQVPLNWRPRKYQLGLYNAICSGQKKRAACVWHRRAGKDLTTVNMTVVMAFKRVGLYWHVLPTYAQGKKIAWNGMDGSGRKFTSFFPEETVKRIRNDEMMIELTNGSIWQIVGGDNPDRLVGSNPIGVVFSEYSLHNPDCWDLIRPILNENGGWAAFIYTARGYNHGHSLLQAAKESDSWFSEVLTVDDTKRPDGSPVITLADIDEDRSSGMPEELIRQEYYCDFSAPLVGSYWGKELEEAELQGRIGDFPHDKSYQVHTSWDLGMADATVIWFWQMIDGIPVFIDHIKDSGHGLDHYIKVVKDKPYVYGDHWAPHDIMVRDFSGSGKTRLEIAADLGLRFNVAGKLYKADSIQAAKMMFTKCRFHKETTFSGVQALKHYRREWDRKNRIWSSRPVHDWSSHDADAIMYGCNSMPKLRNTSLRDISTREPTIDELIQSHLSNTKDAVWERV